MSQSIFERYGGFAAVSRMTSEFYDRVLDSEILAPYFSGVDMRRLIDHQTKFMAYVMGGPASYSDDQIQRAHQKLDIDDASFKEMTRLLRETLGDFDFDESDIGSIIQAIDSRKGSVVSGS